MDFTRHSEYAGRHAFLSPSKHHWSNYDEEKLVRVYGNHLQARLGDAMHAFAADAIRLGVKLPRTTKTINAYVNDAIGFRMSPEVQLVYSENCFGSADAIGFRDNTLRISDLKTGATPAHMRQLEIYAAIFCLEYHYKPGAINIILRIYQSDEVHELIPEVDDILHIMDKIVTFDKLLTRTRLEAA